MTKPKVVYIGIVNRTPDGSEGVWFIDRARFEDIVRMAREAMDRAENDDNICEIVIELEGQNTNIRGYAPGELQKTFEVGVEDEPEALDD